MSGASDDPLAGLLGSARGNKRKKTNTDALFGKSNSDENKSGGLNPLDLLALPAAQRDAINWLSRRKQATLEEIAAALKLDVESAADTLKALRKADYLKEALVDNQIYYRVVFGGKVSRSGRGVPSNIWNAVDLDNTVFLKSIPLFAHLDQETLKELASELDQRHFRRNEIIAWQGDTEQDVTFIKNGIVGVTRLLPGSHDESSILAYLKQGDIIGEVTTLMQQESAANTTATALSEVDVLAMKARRFVSYLKKDRQAALALSRLLLKRLHDTNERIMTTSNDSRLALVFGVGQSPGQTTLGASLAMTLSHVTQGRCVYTEHPDMSDLRKHFDIAEDSQQVYHPQNGKFDVATIRTKSGLPRSVRTTLVMDRLLQDYSNIVIALPGTIDDSIAYMLEKANQLIIVFSPQQDSIKELKRLVEELRGVMHPEKTNLFVVGNHTMPNTALPDLPIQVHFEIPYYERALILRECRGLGDLPTPVSRVTDLLADRLGRTNAIGIYLPEKVEGEVDPVQETLGFLGSIFGGATATTAEGQSKEDGTPETLHVIRTYVTKADMDRNLSKVLAFVEELKNKIGQDALAIEINTKLMLV